MLSDVKLCESLSLIVYHFSVFFSYLLVICFSSSIHHPDVVYLGLLHIAAQRQLPVMNINETNQRSLIQWKFPRPAAAAQPHYHNYLDAKRSPQSINRLA